MSLLSVRQGMIGGLATYVRQLASALAARDPDFIQFFMPVHLESDWRATLPPEARLVPVSLNNDSMARRASYEVLALPALARRRGCDVLFYPNTTAPLLKSRRGPVPVITIFDVMYRSQEHDTPLHKRLFLDFCYAVIRRRRTRVITISEFSKRDIAEHVGIRPDRIRPVYCGVDEIFFGGAPGADRPRDVPDAPYVLSVAATYPHKRLPVVVSAFEEIASVYRELRLVMVGTEHGSQRERDRLLGTIEASPVRNRIVRLANLPWDVMPSLYGHAQALIHGSQFEGFGFPIAEAMACGTPVAAAPAGAVVEILNGAGEVAGGWGSDDLAAALERILRWDVTTRQTRTARGAQIAGERFRWSRVAKAMQEEFRNVAAR